MVFRIGTADTGGTFDTQGMAVAEVFNESRPPEERCELTRSSASIDNANRLDRGEIEFGFMASNWVPRAGRGTAPFDHPIGLRMVSPANAGPIFFVASGGYSRGEHRRSRRQAGGGGSQGQRHDPARPHHLRYAGYSLLGLHPGLHELPGGSGRPGGGGGGRPVPVPDPQCRDDRSERAGPGQGGPVPRGADRAGVVAGSLLQACDHAPGRLPGRRRRHSADSRCSTSW